MYIYNYAYAYTHNLYTFYMRNISLYIYACPSAAKKKLSNSFHRF